MKERALLLLLCIAAGTFFPSGLAAQQIRWGMSREEVREEIGPDGPIRSTSRFLMYQEDIEGYPFSVRYAFSRQGTLRTVTYAIRVTGEEEEIIGIFRLLERAVAELDRRLGELRIREVMIEGRDRTEQNRRLYNFLSRIPGIRDNAAERLFDFIRQSGKDVHSATVEWEGKRIEAVSFATVIGTSRLDFLLRLQPEDGSDAATETADAEVPSLRDLLG